MVSALLIDLLEVNRKLIIEDYLLSGMDTKKKYMEFVLDIIDKEYGGTVNYLTTYCKIPLHSLNLIKIKLLKSTQND